MRLACARTYTSEGGYQSSLKEGIRADNAEQCVFRAELRTISPLLAFVGFREFSKCFRMLLAHKFFARHRPFVSCVIQTYWKLRLHFFPRLSLSSFCFFILGARCSALFILLRARFRHFVCFLCRVIKFVQTRRVDEMGRMKLSAVLARRQNLICPCGW